MTPKLVTGAIVGGSYRLSDELGRGGMGEVWAAVHQVTGREVAVKFLRAAAHRDPAALARFQREARAACAVNHPNVVEILDFAEREGEEPMIVMERLRGETLADKLAREGALPLEVTAGLMVQAISAVGTAHARGIVHRDLKPSNIFIGQRSREAAAVVKVLDFGIAKWAELQEGEGELRTETGSTLGTPSYMAPEQAIGEKTLDHRADVWALGVILYECLAGIRPVEGENAAQIIARLMSTGIMPIERVAPSVPPEVAQLVRQMLTRDVARRSSNLRDAFAILSRHTSISVPDFPEPGVRPAAPDSASAKVGNAPAFNWTPTIQSPAAAAPTTGAPTTTREGAQTSPAPRSTALRYGALALGIGALGFIWLTRTRDSTDTAARDTASASPAASAPVTPAPAPALAPTAAPATQGSAPALDEPLASSSERRAPKARKAGALPAVAPSASATSTETRGLLAGAACEKSSDCESRKCVAYSCR